jgi:hypothetical protein
MAWNECRYPAIGSGGHHVQAKAKEAKSFHSTDPTEPMAATRAETARSSRPRADQFCVYNASIQNTENRIAAFVSEYKAPHELPLGYIYKGLDDMEFEDAIRCRKTDTRGTAFADLLQRSSHLVENDQSSYFIIDNSITQ